MSASITFSCGCEINEHSVLGMCIHHVIEMQKLRAEREQSVSEFRRKMLADIESVIRGERH